MANISIYVADLEQYNAGNLVGRWIDLPAYDLTEQLDGLGEEQAIHDYETNVDGLAIDEYANINDLNTLAERLETLEAWELQTVQAILETCADLEEALQVYEEQDFTVLDGVSNEYDLGYEFMHQLGEIERLPDFAQRYFDYEAFGRDLTFDGWTITDQKIAICR